MTNRAHVRTIMVLILIAVFLNVQVRIPIDAESTIPISSHAEIKPAQLSDKNIISIDTLKLGSDYVNIDGWALATYNDYLYMTSWEMAESKGKMIIVDISDPTNMVEVGRVESLGSCRQVCVIGNIAYVADEGNGLWIFNVSDPADVSVLGQYSISSLRGVYIHHQIAYLPTYYDGLRIVDVSDPTNPIEVGTYAPYSQTYRILVQDDCAYLANAYGLEILNVTNPISPSLIGRVRSNNFKTHIYLKDDIVYISRPWSRLLRFNVSDLTNPYEFEEYFYIGGVAEIQIEGSLLFASSSYLGFKIYNIHNFDIASQVGLFNPDGESRAVLYKDGYLYLVDHHSGLWCLEHDCDEDELYSRREYEIGTFPDNPDSDSDLMPDNFEVYNDLNPLLDDADEDYDLDTLTNLQEYLIGTHANNTDSDADQLPDKWEVQYSLNPLVDDSHQDPDMDNLDNLLEYEIGTSPILADSDFDGYLDSWEYYNGFDPLNPIVESTQYFVSIQDLLGLGIVTMGIGTTLWILKKIKSSDTYEGYPYDGTSSRR